jgi:glutamine synthetase
MRIGVDVLPAIPKDTTDRNRTSPIAFTGNKFEFRMLGSSQSIAGPNIALNTIMAEELGQFADVLENAEDFEATLQKLVCDTLRAHQQIIFNGNGYSQSWQEEAARRGLSNLRSTAKALPTYVSQKNIDLVTRHGIYSESEFRARHEIHLESYSKLIRIEAKTMVDMVLHQLLPAGMQYASDLAEAVSRKERIGVSAAADKSLAQRLGECCDRLYENAEALVSLLKSAPADSLDRANYFSDKVVPAMAEVRKDADLLEELFAENSVDLIYLHFSDPWPKKRNHKRRLTYMPFLKKYEKILKDQGVIIFKTDNEAFYDDSIEYFKQSSFKLLETDRNYYAEGEPMTAYQAKFVAEGKPIFYAKYKIDKV